jgi:PAS domain S-box-containing protein
MSSRLDDIYKELVNEGKISTPKGNYEFEFDLMGNLLSATSDAAKVSEYPLKTIENMSVWEVVDENDHDLMLEKFAARKEGKRVDPYEVTLLTRSGKRIRIKVETTPVIENDEIVKVKGRFFILD